MAHLAYYLKTTRFKRNLLEESDLDPRCLIKRWLITSMANFSRQTHINDPDQTALREDSLGRNGPGQSFSFKQGSFQQVFEYQCKPTTA